MEQTDQVPDAQILPGLKENSGSLSITIDKSVNKAIGRLMAVLFGCAAMVGAGIVLAVWMIIAYTQTERQEELLKYYLLELDGKVIEAGLKAPEDSIAKKLREAEKERQK